MTPEPLPAELGELLVGTVGPGGLPGVLADWIDERSESWRPLSAALRAATPVTGDPPPDSYFGPPRFLVLAEGVVATLTGPARRYYNGPEPKDVPRLGLYRTAPGRGAAYRLDVGAELPEASRAELRALFEAKAPE